MVAWRQFTFWMRFSVQARALEMSFYAICKLYALSHVHAMFIGTSSALKDAQLNNFQQIFDTCCTEIASSQELDLTPQDVSGMLF